MKKLLLAALIAALPITANAASLQRYQSGFRTIDGDQLNKMVDVVNNITGNGTAIPGTFTTLSATGAVTFGSTLAVTGASTLTGAVGIGSTLGVTGATTVTSASASALTVGRLGATTPALKVDASTATSITGLHIKSAAASGGLALSAIGETNVNTTLDAAGNGTISLNVTGTGNIVLGRAMTGVSSSMTAGYTAKSGTAVPASAGALAAGAPISMFSEGIKIWVVSDTPAFSATKGDIAINTGGSSSSTRLFINNGTTNWVAITTAS